MLEDLLNYETTFSSQGLVEFTKEHAELPVLAVTGYLFFVFYVPELMAKRPPLNLRTVVAVWNVILSTFSIVGVTRTVPHLLAGLQEHGLQFTVCQNPADWYLKGGPGLWVGLFVYSKFPELMDTVFLILQKKKVIFLHWFHHCTVLLYCWHAYNNTVAPGIWFAAMNYTVHSVMYLYYALMSLGIRKMTRPLAPLITTLQLTQMIMGLVVTVLSAYWHTQDSTSCHVDAANYKLGLAMYFSYFVLFAFLFYELYLGPNAKLKLFGGKVKRSSSDKTEDSGKVCGVDASQLQDPAGFFHAKTQVGSLSPPSSSVGSPSVSEPTTPTKPKAE
eukprot:m.82504 g.82504  ORF g.82504 m.82504 type:complete len:331 (+) comp14731_c0_seq4:79-1071(+)